MDSAVGVMSGERPKNVFIKQRNILNQKEKIEFRDLLQIYYRKKRIHVYIDSKNDGMHLNRSNGICTGAMGVMCDSCLAVG